MALTVARTNIRNRSYDSTMDRRRFVLGMGAAGLIPPARAVNVRGIAALEKQIGGRIGAAALDTGSGRRLTHRADEHFAMCSTFKWMLAAAVLARIDGGSLRRDRHFTYRADDLPAHSPVTTEHLADGLSLLALCAAAVEQSDNGAANLLLKTIGGPPALTAYLRELGDPITRLDRFELSLNTNIPGDLRDTTTPAAMVATMQRILVGDALSSDSRTTLLDWMTRCETGHDRLRAGLPSTWTAGDKTGTGEHGAVNDVAIAWPPMGPPVLMAVYMSGSTRPAAALGAVHARVADIVVATFTQDPDPGAAQPAGSHTGFITPR
jgi:beta-lactamase class A